VQASRASKQGKQAGQASSASKQGKQVGQARASREEVKATGKEVVIWHRRAFNTMQCYPSYVFSIKLPPFTRQRHYLFYLEGGIWRPPNQACLTIRLLVAPLLPVSACPLQLLSTRTWPAPHAPLNQTTKLNPF
jgi:hypothetical protein